jgi:hypothetical protein
MKDKFGRRSPRPAWPGWMGVLVVTAGVALLAAACGGGGSPSSTSTATAGTSTAYTKALAYAKCIRSHGVPNFPDPSSNGTFTNPLNSPGSNGGTDNVSSTVRDAAVWRHASIWLPAA